MTETITKIDVVKPGYTLIAFVIGAVLVYTASKLGVASAWIYHDELKESFQLSDSDLMSWSSASRSPYAYLLGVLIAYLGDLYSRVFVLCLSIAVLVCWLITAPLLDSVPLLASSYFLFVSFGVAILPLVFALLFSGGGRGRNATTIGVVAAAEILSVMIFMQVSVYSDWSAMLRWLAGVALGGGVIVLLSGIRKSSRESIDLPQPSNAETIWVLFLATMLASSAIYAFSSWGAVLIFRSAGDAAGEVGRWALIPLMCMLLGRIVGGVLADWNLKQQRVSELSSALVGTGVMILALTGLIWMNSLAPLVVISALVAFGGGLLYAPTVALVLKLSNPKLLATNVAMVLFAINLGLLLGPLFAGFLSDYYYHNGESAGGVSLRKALTWFSVPAFLAMCLFAFASKRRLPTR